MAGNDAEPDRAVSFEVVVRGLFAAHPDEDALAFEATRHAGDHGQPRSELVFSRVGGGTDGVARVEGLTGGSGVLVSGLPEGASYAVSEVDADALICRRIRHLRGERRGGGLRAGRRPPPRAPSRAGTP